MTPERLPSRYPEPILVVGAYGYRNVGDEAILAGLLRSLDSERVTVVSRSPAETTALHQVRAVSPAMAVGALRRHRTVVIGGGGLFGRDMGLLGRLLPVYGLLAASACTVAIEGVGIDGDLPPLRRRLVSALVSRAERVVVRDSQSAQIVNGWGVDAIVQPDYSGRMRAAPPSIGEELMRGTGVDAGRPVVGLALTAVNRAVAGMALEAIPNLIRRMPGVEFCLIPMSQHPFVARHNDLLFAQRIQRAAPRARILDGLHHPASILSAFRSLAAVVGMRYHSLLFAERAGIPIVPIPYAPKCQSWASEHDIDAVPPVAPALAAAVAHCLDSRQAAS